MQVSVVIPVRNEESSLPVLAESLRRQTLPPAEIIIVNGGSTDGTLEAAERLAASDERIRVLDVGRATPGRGRNLGVAAARNEWVAFTDGGIRLEPTWLEELARAVERDPETEVVYGNFEPVTDSAFKRYAALAYVPPKLERPEGVARGPFIASTLLRRGVWEAVGGFPDLRAAEDLIFIERIEAAGFRVRWAPRAMVWWDIQPTLGRTFRRFVLYSKHNVWAGRQGHWHYGVARQYAVAALLVALAVAHSPWWLAPLALGFAARVGRSLWRQREGRGLAWALNPVQFACVGLVLLTIDLATFVGWARAALTRPAGLSAEPKAAP